MKIITRFILALVIGLLVSIDDFAWPASDCSDLYDIIETETDQDGNTLFSIFVNKIDGSDMQCYRFGLCIYELIGSSSGMGAVEIINFDDYWVPSRWSWIDITRAAVLAEIIDFEEYSWLSSYAWASERTD
jgi:hypothetical protein